MKISLSTLLTTEQEDRLLSLCGPTTWYGNGVPNAQILNEIYAEANAAFFANRLTRPKITMRRFKAPDLRSTMLAYWDQNFRDLNVDPRLFAMRRPLLLCQALVHEMCHQAVTDIDQVTYVQTDPVRKTHGRNWMMWMMKCGLPPEPITETTEAFPTRE